VDGRRCQWQRRLWPHPVALTRSRS
jgi:hypothetical protein